MPRVGEEIGSMSYMGSNPVKALFVGSQKVFPVDKVIQVTSTSVVAIPVWATIVDVVALGAGGTGAHGGVLGRGTGGASGVFNMATITTPVSGCTLNITLGDPNASNGNTLRSTTVTDAQGNTIVTASGGGDGLNPDNSFNGQAAGSRIVTFQNLSQVICTGGAQQSTTGSVGNFPGGGGAGGSGGILGVLSGPGGAGAPGAVWLICRNSA